MNAVPNDRHGGGNIMLRDYFNKHGTGNSVKVKGTMVKEILRRF